MSSFLPIGSVCKLYDTNQEVMIVGYCFIDEKERYDYVGLMYPSGLIDKKNYLGFNEEKIEKVEFRGYDTDNYKEFIRRLKTELSQNGTMYDNLSFEEIKQKMYEELEKLEGE